MSLIDLSMHWAKIGKQIRQLEYDWQVNELIEEERMGQNREKILAVAHKQLATIQGSEPQVKEIDEYKSIEVEAYPSEVEAPSLPGGEIYYTVRDVTIKECPWLAKPDLSNPKKMIGDVKQGTKIYRYIGADRKVIGSVGNNGNVFTFRPDGYGEWFRLPSGSTARSSW